QAPNSPTARAAAIPATTQPIPTPPASVRSPPGCDRAVAGFTGAVDRAGAVACVGRGRGGPALANASAAPTASPPAVNTASSTVLMTTPPECGTAGPSYHPGRPGDSGYRRRAVCN